jgi:dTDP-4-dehydrorhamnose reductase
MRLLLLGRDGQVGWELRRSLQPLGEVHAPGRDVLDLADASSLAATVRRIRPGVIVNAAAFTAVDAAESAPEQAHAINAVAPRVLAEEAVRLGASLVHYSTDYVFDGRLERAYTERDDTAPLSVYGRSKLAGEHAICATGVPHLVFRTSWVYAARGRNFLRTMIRLMRERERLSVVDDQRGAPTWARTIADVTAAVIARAGTSSAEVAEALHTRGGIFNLVARGATTWHGFASAIASGTIDSSRKLKALESISTSQYPTPAARPSNSVLATDRLRTVWQVHLPAWQESLRLCLEERPDGVQPLEGEGEGR